MADSYSVNPLTVNPADSALAQTLRDVAGVLPYGFPGLRALLATEQLSRAQQSSLANRQPNQPPEAKTYIADLNLYLPNSPLAGVNGYVRLPIPPLISVTRQVRIIEEEVDSLPGTIKETSQTGEWIIGIAGIIKEAEETTTILSQDSYQIPISTAEANGTDRFPWRWWVFFADLMRKADLTFAVTCPLLNQLGVNYVTLNEVVLPADPGRPDSFPFSMRVTSDSNYLLRIPRA
jgi:hypothetical protein